MVEQYSVEFLVLKRVTVLDDLFIWKRDNPTLTQNDSAVYLVQMTVEKKKRIHGRQ